MCKAIQKYFLALYEVMEVIIYNNPTSRQFESVYKYLLVYCEVIGSQYANCLDQIPVSILTVISSHNKVQIIPSLDFNLNDIDDISIFEN